MNQIIDATLRGARINRMKERHRQWWHKAHCTNCGDAHPLAELLQRLGALGEARVEVTQAKTPNQNTH